MPLLPDVGSFNQRPIPQSSSAILNVPANPLNKATEDLGRSLQNAGDIAFKLNERDVENQKRINEANATSAFLKAKVDADNAFNDDQDYQTFNTRYQQTINKAKDQALSLITDPTEKQLFEAKITPVIENGIIDIQKLAKKKEVDNGVGNLINLTDTNREAALRAPNEITRMHLITTTQDAIDSAKDAGYITDVQAEKYRKDFTKDYAIGYAKTLSPQEQINYLSEGKSKVANFIPFDVRSEMLDRAHKEIQIQTDRADAKAIRALTQMDQQISSGIPATQAQWLDWGNKIKGSSYTAEFNQRSFEEKQVQDILQKPIQEQTDFVQKKEAALLQTGGTVQEAMNINRLKSAISTNIKQIQDAPMQYVQSRMGQDVKPIDLSTLSVPGNLQAVSDEMDNRLTNLSAMQKLIGGQVAPKLLLPQEAQALSTHLQNLTPEEQLKVFNGLQSSIKDDKAYQTVMQQIAPDSPVKAIAGVIAGYQGNILSQSNYFSPDQFLSPKDIATTMLKGEEILNRTKSEKGADGKTVNFSMPSDDKFLQSVQDKIGDTFAGRPQAFQKALQATRAYYAGAASDSGSFSSEVDPTLLNNSVKFAIGNINSDYGKSIVLPWGMNDSTFKDSFHQNLINTLQQSGYSPADANKFALGNISLTNFGDNSYMVLDNNRRPKIIDGRPLVVEVKP